MFDAAYFNVLDNLLQQYGKFGNWVKYVREEQSQGKKTNVMKMPDGDPPTEPNGNRNLNFILNDRKWKDAYLAWAKDQLNYENLQFLQAVETFKNQNTTWEMAVKIKKDYLDNDFINLYDDIKTAFMKRFDSLSPSG